MISSTARDLPLHREQVRLGCERAGFAPHDMMENMSALDADALEASLKMVEEADVYIGIFAYRYGYVPDGHEISITEMEYDRAVALEKPRLIFFIHEDHLLTGKEIETGSGAAKLGDLKDKISKARVAAFFKSPDDLRACVLEALSKLRDDLEADTPRDAVARSAATLHRTGSIPAPPKPYIAHPYTLLQMRKLVGRRVELNTLTDWVANPRSLPFDARIFCFVAIGGMGKSALTWDWFNNIAPNEMSPLAGRMWWSFYESDATFENFLNRALCYVSGESEAAVRALHWHDREAQLLQHLNEKPFLLALDGLERILVAYHRMDASSLADDDYDVQTANYVTGAHGLPATAAKSFVGQHRLRQTTDPRAGAFLQKLARIDKSRILISTRLYPTALQLQTGAPGPGCFAYFLPGLSDDDAVGLWRALGVTGARSDLVPIFRSVESHPLLVQALASEVANHRKAPGDFAQWRLEHPQFDPTSLPLVQSRTHILQFALEGLSKQDREVLHTLVGFRMPASYETLEALLVGADKACGSARQLDRSLTDLEDRGLIGWDREANRYDAHPIVRGVVWTMTGDGDRHNVLTALEAHFEPMATPDYLEVESIADLTPAIERYNTLVSLGRHSDALDLFHDRLAKASLYRLAAHRERIEWLERLFSDDQTVLSAIIGKRDQGFALTSLALSYSASGQPGRAVPLHERVIAIDESENDAENLSTALRNSHEVYFQTGALYDSENFLRRALKLSRSSEDNLSEAISLQELGHFFGAKNEQIWGQVALYRSHNIFAKLQHSQANGIVMACNAERLLWLQNYPGASKSADLAWDLAQNGRYAQDLVRAALTQGRVAVGLGKSSRAEERLNHALVHAREVNLVEPELMSLIALAALDLKSDCLPQAKTKLDEVWEPAERGPYRLLQADAYNVLADIERTVGDTNAAIDAATKAYKAAWCDGPPHAYYWGLKAAKAHLAALGAPVPDMPPFDASKFEPMPEVDINPKDEYWVDPDSLD